MKHLKKVLLIISLVSSISGLIDQFKVYWLNLGYFKMGYFGWLSPSLVTGLDNKIHLVPTEMAGSINFINVLVFLILTISSLILLINQKNELGKRFFKSCITIILLSNSIMLITGEIFIGYTFSHYNCLFWVLFYIFLSVQLKNIFKDNISNNKTSNITRLINLIGDSIIFYTLSFYYTMEDFNLLFHVINFTLFYIISEFLFLQTPSKMLTGSTITVKNKRFKSILLRSLLRLLPFEALSIFSKKGLYHDRFSKTEVMKNYIQKN